MISILEVNLVNKSEILKVYS